MTAHLRQFLRDWAALLTLTGFAIAQPIYAILGENVEFFPAHGVGPWTLIGFAAVLSLGIATLLALVVAAIGLVSGRLASAAMALVAGILVAAFALPMIGRLGFVPPVAAVAIAGALGIAAVAFARRMLSFATFAAPVALVFPLLFLFFTPASTILFPERQAVSTPLDIANPPPIVMIVFDEFSAFSLMDETGGIDDVRFPNFAAFAREATWFPWAASVSNQTVRAVPAILTGKYPSPSDTVTGHTENLFSWLGGTYRVKAMEPVIPLCPTDVCEQTLPPVELLAIDTAILYFHTVVPAEMARGWLPPVADAWAAFGDNAVVGDADAPGKMQAEKIERQRLLLRTGNAGFRGGPSQRRNNFEFFIESMDASVGSLDFMHLLLPHRPWEFTQAGQLYYVDGTDALMIERGAWRNGATGDFSFNRYLLQVGFVDTMIGRLVARLKELGRYEDTLIVLTADHGITFDGRANPRAISKETGASVLRVPLFIKFPGQSEGAISPRRALTVDIVPTIADVLGAPLPWRTAGTSLIAAEFPERHEVEIEYTNLAITPPRKTFLVPAEDLSGSANLPRQFATFGSRIPLNSTVIRGPHAELIGSPVTGVATGDALYGMTVTIDNRDRLDRVSPAGNSPLPLLVRGQILASGQQQPSLWPLAVALNGTIAMTLDSYRLEGKNTLHFLGVLPEAGLVEGRNDVEVFAIDDASGTVELRPFRAGARAFSLAAEENGMGAIVATDGASFALTDAGSPFGTFTLQKTDAGIWRAVGYAVDVEAGKPASGVVVFDRDRSIHFFTPNRQSKAAAEQFESASVLRSGFVYPLPSEPTDWSDGDVRIFVLGREQARELRRCPDRPAWSTRCG